MGGSGGEKGRESGGERERVGEKGRKGEDSGGERKRVGDSGEERGGKGREWWTLEYRLYLSKAG